MKPTITAAQRDCVGFSPSIGCASSTMKIGASSVMAVPSASGRKRSAAEEAHGGGHETRRARELQAQVLRAPEARARRDGARTA